jgi:hypothetical protein
MASQSSNDRAPTIEVTHKIVEYPDRRIKPVVYIMVYSGIRLGTRLKRKNVIPITDYKGKIIAAKLDVYIGDIEGFCSFMNREGYPALRE